MGLEALEEETQDDEVEVVYTLQSLMINIYPSDIPENAQDVPSDPADWDTYDPAKPCQPHLGDAWAKVAKEALYVAQPLPGDTPWVAQDPLKQQFHVVKIEDGPFYAIYDHHQL